MIDIHEQSMINLAEGILKERQEPIDLYQLFDMVLEKSGNQWQELDTALRNFYADLTSSAKFTYMGNNTWDLKKNQAIELWEKDGSHYNEYTEVEDPVLDIRIAKEEAEELKHQAMLERRRQEAIEAEEAASIEAAAEVEAPIKTVEVVKPVIKEVIEEVSLDEIEEETIEETVVDKPKEAEDTPTDEEDFDDFDEDEYNKYMDTYEDEYDK